MSSQKKDLFKLLGVLGGGVMCAMLIVGLMVYFYSPSHQLQLSHVLISPQTIETLSKTSSSKTSVKQISFFKKEEGKWLTKELSFQEYASFYDEVSSLKSLQEDENHRYSLCFSQAPFLLVKFHHQSDGHPLSQEVQFSQDSQGLFRIEIYNAQDQNKWAYFQSEKPVSIIGKL